MEIPLIEFVQNNSFLYDARHEHYRNTMIKDEKWLEISKEFDMPVEKVKQRWKSLRDSYNRYKKKITNSSGSVESGKLQVDWKYFNKLRFLDDIPERRISSQYIKPNSSSVTKTEEQETSLGWEEEDSDSSISFSESKMPLIEEFVQRFEAGTIPDEYPEEKTMEDTSDTSEFEVEKNREENVDVLFGKMLLSYIKDLSRVNNIKVKREIFEVLTKYVEKEELKNNNSYSLNATC
ncbi:uncharacterized protein LOC129609139 [Condylostylus longicornis]|uniref:uncharacterized protein LOC129609139 n=1 Tax=Condylostylus longicornis TaxID=2530218 RepID=UPI00244E5B7E|nr:uncharacterized protein LOC129609139 [Condylostylus longicornis]